MTDSDPDATRVDQPAVDETSVFAPVGDGGGGYVPPTRGTPPEGPSPDRRPWIIAGLLALLVVVLILLLLAQGDDDKDDVDSSSSTTSSEVTTSSSSTTSSTALATTTSGAPTTTASPVVTVPPAKCKELGGGPAKPGLAAETLYDAWVRGDKACAAELTTPTAFAKLFSRDGTDAHDEFVACTEEDVPDPHTDCQFYYEGGATHYLMNYSDTDGWQAYDITQVAD